MGIVFWIERTYKSVISVTVRDFESGRPTVKPTRLKWSCPPRYAPCSAAVGIAGKAVAYPTLST